MTKSKPICVFKREYIQASLRQVAQAISIGNHIAGDFRYCYVSRATALDRLLRRGLVRWESDQWNTSEAHFRLLRSMEASGVGA
jgi:hypothetical protein